MRLIKYIHSGGHSCYDKTCSAILKTRLHKGYLLFAWFTRMYSFEYIAAGKGTCMCAVWVGTGSKSDVEMS